MNSATYLHRRQQIAATMAPDSMLILAGNSEIERTADATYPFRQSNNFLYLTGISQPDAILVLKKTQDERIIEELYITQLHPFMAVWEGRSNQIAELRTQSGIDSIQEYKERDELIAKLLKDSPQIVYIDMPDTAVSQIAAWQLWNLIKESHPDVELAAINPEIENLRVIKSDEEVDVISQAISETHLAIAHAKSLLKVGVTEREIAAEFIKFCSARGYEQAFPPIISFGKNTCIIHHQPDATKMNKGDLVLFDVGVEVEGYAADISRTFSIDELSERQQQIIDTVRLVQQEALALMKPGVKFNEFERQAAQIMANTLVEIGLFETLEKADELEGELGWPAYRRYFKHIT